jgi:hypothetical protein
MVRNIGMIRGGHSSAIAAVDAATLLQKAGEAAGAETAAGEQNQEKRGQRGRQAGPKAVNVEMGICHPEKSRWPPEAGGQCVELKSPKLLGLLLHPSCRACKKCEENGPAEQFHEEQEVEECERGQPVLGRASGIRIATECLAEGPTLGQQLALALC